MRPALAALALAASLATAARAAEVTGGATYLARIATPPGAVFEAVLEDVSRADAPAETVGRVRIADAGNPPYAFAIAYEPGANDPRGVYAVRASLRWPDGRLVFTTDKRHTVLNRGAGAHVEIVMVRVSGGAETDSPLVGPRWRLFAMGEAPVETEGQRETPFLVFEDDRALYGSGGCNRLRGSFETGEDGAVAFGPAASTMMACDEETMRRERGLHGMLEAAERYAITGDRLTLSANGAPMAVFVAEDAD